jgi:hypothetical protein
MADYDSVAAALAAAGVEPTLVNIASALQGATPGAQAGQAAVSDLNALPPTDWNAPANPSAGDEARKAAEAALKASGSGADAAAAQQAVVAQHAAKIEDFKRQYGLDDASMAKLGIVNPPATPVQTHELQAVPLVSPQETAPQNPMEGTKLGAGVPEPLPPPPPPASPQNPIASAVIANGIPPAPQNPMEGTKLGVGVPEPLPEGAAPAVAKTTKELPSPEAVPLVNTPAQPAATAPAQPAAASTPASTAQAAPTEPQPPADIPLYPAPVGPDGKPIPETPEQFTNRLMQNNIVAATNAANKQAWVSTQENELKKTLVGQQIEQQARIENTRQEIVNFAQTHAAYAAQQQETALKTYMSQNLDPFHYWHSMSTFGQIATGIGLFLGSIGAYATGGQNYAAKMVSENIDKDIDMQKFAILKNKDTANAWGDMSKMYQGMGLNANQSADAATLALKNMGVMQAEKIMTQYGATQAQIDQYKALAGVYSGSAELQIKVQQARLDNAVKNLTAMKMGNDIKMQPLQAAKTSAELGDINAKRQAQGLSPIGSGGGLGGGVTPTQSTGQQPYKRPSNAHNNTPGANQPTDIRDVPGFGVANARAKSMGSNYIPDYRGVQPISVESTKAGNLEKFGPAYEAVHNDMKEAIKIHTEHPNPTGKELGRLQVLYDDATRNAAAADGAKATTPRGVAVFQEAFKGMIEKNINPHFQIGLFGGGIAGNVTDTLKGLRDTNDRDFRAMVESNGGKLSHHLENELSPEEGPATTKTAAPPPAFKRR